MSSHPHHSLPPNELLAVLERVRRRAKGLSVAYGVGLVVLVACGLLVAGGMIDWLLRLPGVPRLIGLAAAAALLGWVAYRFVWKPASRHLSVHDVAGRAEETFPEFDDRLRSSLSFLGAGDAFESDPMRQRTIAEAGEVAGGVRWGDLLQPRAAFVSAGGALGAVAMLTLIALLLGPLAGTILGRLVDPLNPNHQWPKRFVVAPLDLPNLHPAGRPLEVTARLDKGDPFNVQPTVFFQVGDGPVRKQLMSARDDGTFVATIDPRLAADSDRGNARVWVEAGDDISRPKSVGVVTRPALLTAIADVTPPAYVQNAVKRHIDLTGEPAVVGDGSRVTLNFTFNKPLAGEDAPSVSLSPVGTAGVPDVTFEREGPRGVTASFTASETTRFQIAATGVDGFDADASQTFEVIVRPDQQPAVQIDNPRRNESRTPEAVVPVEVTAEDDFGFKSVDLVITKLVPASQTGGWTTTVPLLTANGAAENVEDTQGAASVGDGIRHALSYEWDLSEIAENAEGGGPLQPGDVIEFYAVAQDNFALDGEYHEPVESGRLRITIISQQELNRRVISDLQAVKDEVASTKQRQDQTRRETEEWAAQVADKAELDAADQEAADRLGRQQSSTAAQAKRLARKAAEARQTLEENNSPAEDLKQLTENVARDLDRAAEGPMRAASSELAEAESAGDPQARNAAAEEATSEQQEASERLDAVMEEMEQIGSLRQSIDSVQGLLNEQRELSERTDAVQNRNVGRKPSDMSAEDREQLEELADEQEALAERTREAIERMREQAENMAGDEAAQEAMKRAADSAQQQDVPGQQQQAARQSRQNSRAAAQQARQQAEIGLQVVLNELQEAEREKLRQLERQLTELVEQIERLVQRQAGHNLDNLQLRDIEGEALAELVVAAGREEANAVEPTVQRLSAGQEQTERNTRDLSRPAEEAPEGGEIAARLSRAAARMERAAVFIRGEDLVAAYEPPQVQALSALREALEAARQEQQRVQQEIEQQQKAAIRQELVELRDAQANEVNAPTDEVRRQVEAGDLDGRRLIVAVNPIATRQRELSEKLAEVGERLASVGGTAFVYAGERAQGDMDAVAERLGERDVSAPVTIRQNRIVTALDAMIDSLKIELDPERFEQNSQAGGQQQGQGQGQQQQGPKLPPQAELQLVRRLQEGVNATTKDLAELKQLGDGAPADLDQQLDAVAGEQGDLRSVLDQMLRNYSNGERGFGPEPDPTTLLPEETGDGEEPQDVDQQLDDRDLLEDLLGEAARDGGAMNGEGEVGEGAEEAGEGAEEAVQPATGDAARIGDYMARSRQRLGLARDPGPVTQVIQDRIVERIDDLIEQARQQQQASSSSSSSSAAQQQQQQGQQQPGQAQQRPQPGSQQANAGDAQQGQQPGDRQPGAQENDPNADAPEGTAADLSQELAETLAEWGGLTPRQRAAILGNRGDQPLDAYRELTDAFYRKLNDDQDD